jgi:hypothetical protein
MNEIPIPCIRAPFEHVNAARFHISSYCSMASSAHALRVDGALTRRFGLNKGSGESVIISEVECHSSGVYVASYHYSIPPILRIRSNASFDLKVSTSSRLRTGEDVHFIADTRAKKPCYRVLASSRHRLNPFDVGRRNEFFSTFHNVLL